MTGVVRIRGRWIRVPNWVAHVTHRVTHLPCGFVTPYGVHVWIDEA